MKISRLEFVSLLLCAAFLAFSAGWFLRGEASAQPVRVETQRTLSGQETLSLPAPTPSLSPLERGEKIDINTADADTLALLPGIGEKRAQDIVDYRAANGPFRIPEDLTKVKGIGESTLEGLIEHITAGEDNR